MPQDSTPNEAEPLEAELPGWGQSRRSALDQLDPTATTVTTPSPSGAPPLERAMATADLPPMTADEARAAWDEHERELLDDEYLEGEPTGPTSPRLERRSHRSDGDPRIAGVAAQLFATIAGAASLALNATIGRGSGAFVMHPEEAAGIGEPLGRIAARHAPIDTGEATDMGDAIEAGAAAAAYAARASIEQMVQRSGDAMPDPQAPQS